tara:strand:+ start:137 stop:823 length:687 start_codon:yes stop_codon:yes gene_type:complete
MDAEDQGNFLSFFLAILSASLIAWSICILQFELPPIEKYISSLEEKYSKKQVIIDKGSQLWQITGQRIQSVKILLTIINHGKPNSVSKSTLVDAEIEMTDALLQRYYLAHNDKYEDALDEQKKRAQIKNTIRSLVHNAIYGGAEHDKALVKYQNQLVDDYFDIMNVVAKERDKFKKQIHEKSIEVRKLRDRSTYIQIISIFISLCAARLLEFRSLGNKIYNFLRNLRQ